jgi:hypothetical protein
VKAAAGLLLTVPLLLAAPCAVAQRGHVAPSPAVAARLRATPEHLMGLMRAESEQSEAMFAYRGRANLDPVVTVVLSDAARPASLRAAAELGRAEAIRAGLIETRFEGKFSVPGHPGASTYFGDHLTRQGIKESWIAEYDGVRILVSATIYRAEDRRAVFDAIRTDLLGGAEMTASVTPAETN